MAIMEGLISLLLCSVIIVVCAVAAIVLIVVKEGSSSASAVYTDDLWKPSCSSLHPFWLLAFRFLAFLYSSTILITDVIASGSFSIFYFYTQWSFLLLIAYFGMATVVSALAASRSRLSGTSFPSSESAVGLIKSYYSGGGDVESKNAIATLQMYWETVFAESEQLASFSGFLMQIIFQTLAGAAVLTDAVYWLGLFPLMKELPRAYDFLEINLHGMNAIFIVVDMMLNRMSFPLFRGAYFTLWTATYVLFQWSVHALGVQWWPYPFLDPTQKYAPVWYLILCGAHVLCYGLMWGAARIKHRFIFCFSS